MHITAVLRIRIRIQIRIQIPRIHVFLGLLDPDRDPDPLVRGMIQIRIWILLTLSKNSKKNLDFSCFVTSFHRILRNYDAMTS
jgi:hypothetical protein